jgi:hypothetical protein
MFSNVLCLVTIFMLIIIIIIIIPLVLRMLCQHFNNKELSLLSICLERLRGMPKEFAYCIKVCIGTNFCPTLKMSAFCRYFRKF